MEYNFRENFIRIAALLGLLAVLLLGAWGIIQLAFFIPSLFNTAGSTLSSALTSTSAEELSVRVPPGTMTAEHIFPVSWAHTGGKGAYSYSVSYSCTDGLSLVAPLPNGSYQPVACNTPFNYIQATSSMPLVALVQSAQPLTTTISISATELSSGAISKTANTQLSVASTQKPAATIVAPAVQKLAAAKSAPTLYGQADLTVRIVYAVPNYNTNRTTVEFVVENIGTNVAPYGWSVETSIPFNGSYPYNSGPQKKLNPGDNIRYTLSYQNSDDKNYAYTNPVYPGACLSYIPSGCIGSGTGYGYTNYSGYSYTGSVHERKTLVITVDPQNQIYENNKSNNTASASY